MLVALSYSMQCSHKAIHVLIINLSKLKIPMSTITFGEEKHSWHQQVHMYINLNKIWSILALIKLWNPLKSNMNHRSRIIRPLFDAKPFATSHWWMSIPYFRDPMVTHARRNLSKVVVFGFTYDNYIYFKVSRSFLENPFTSYPKIIVFHETQSSSCILSNNYLVHCRNMNNYSLKKWLSSIGFDNLANMHQIGWLIT